MWRYIVLLVDDFVLMTITLEGLLHIFLCSMRQVLRTFTNIAIIQGNKSVTRQVSSMIHSAKPIVTPVCKHFFLLFCFARFEKGD